MIRKRGFISVWQKQLPVASWYLSSSRTFVLHPQGFSLFFQKLFSSPQYLESPGVRAGNMGKGENRERMS